MQGGRALRHRLGLCHGQQHAAFPAGRGGCVVAALFLRGAIWGHWDILLEPFWGMAGGHWVWWRSWELQLSFSKVSSKFSKDFIRILVADNQPYCPCMCVCVCIYIIASIWAICLTTKSFIHVL